MAIQNDLSFLNTGLKVVSSVHATEDDGYEEKEIMVKRGGFWERIFDTDPTLHIWDDYKPVVVKVPKRKPAMYRIHDMIVAHPDLIKKLSEAMMDISSAATHASTSIANFSNSYKEYIK